MEFLEFLRTSYTPYHAVKNAADFLIKNGFVCLNETEPWKLEKGGKYFTVRGGSLVAFRVGEDAFKIIASHTDSPCFKLKPNAETAENGFTKLGVEEYGGAVRYSFFDRPLRIAGRIVKRTEEGVAVQLYTSEFPVAIPSLAIHQNRSVNEGFAVNVQTEQPVLSLGESKLPLPEGTLSYDLFAAPDTPPTVTGMNGEFLLSPRLDDLVCGYSSLLAISKDSCRGTCVAALFESEEIGSRTRGGAAGDLLKNVLRRISLSLGRSEEEHEALLSRSLLFSADNAHALHPNHPETSDPCNRATLGGGIVIKQHAGGAYTTDALTAATAERIFEKAGVRYQFFTNRSDTRSGSTLGAISLSQASIPTVDLGVAQLSMHAAAETIALSDLTELQKGFSALYSSTVSLSPLGATLD